MSALYKKAEFFITAIIYSTACTTSAQLFASTLIPQNITNFTPPASIVYSPGRTLLLSATGGDSGNAVIIKSVTGTICTVSGNILNVLAAGTCKLTADQKGNTIYADAPQVSANVVINKASQSITFNPLPNLTIGSASAFKPIASSSSGLSVTFTTDIKDSSVCSAYVTTVYPAGGVGACKVTAIQSGNANYNAAPSVSQTFFINPQSQTIHFAPLPNKTYGEAPFTVSAIDYSNLVVSFNSTTPNVCTVSSQTVTIVSAGVCTITADQAGDTYHYPAPQVSQSFTVNKASQSITFNPLPNLTIGNTPSFKVAVKASSGLPVSITAGPDSICTYYATTIYPRGKVGTCTVTASQSGNVNYNSAPSVTQTFAINPQDQRIIFGALPNKFFGDAPFTLSATSYSGLAVTFNSTTTKVCTVTGNVVSLVGPGTCSITANQAGDSYHNPAPPVTQSFTVYHTCNIMVDRSGSTPASLTSINAAIGKISKSSTTPQVICVKPGEYNEHLTIYMPDFKSGIILQGLKENGLTPVITGKYAIPTCDTTGGTTPDGKQYSCYSWNGLIEIYGTDHVTISGFEITGSLGRCILAHNSSSIEISNNNIHGCRQAGLIVESYPLTTITSQNILIDSNNISDVANFAPFSRTPDPKQVYGMWPPAACVNAVSDATFSNNTVHDAWGEGFIADCNTGKSTRVKINSNVFYDNLSVVGPYIHAADSVNAVNNLIYCSSKTNKPTVWTGMLLAPSEPGYVGIDLSNVSVLGNVIAGCSTNGALLWNTMNGRMMKNVSIKNNVFFNLTHSLSTYPNQLSNYVWLNIVDVSSNDFVNSPMPSVDPSVTMSNNQHYTDGAAAGLVGTDGKGTIPTLTSGGVQYKWFQKQ